MVIMMRNKGFKGSPSRHGLSSKGIHSKNSVFGTNPNTMVQVSNMITNLSDNDAVTANNQSFEVRSYKFASDYIRGSTKHYTKGE